MHLIDYTSNDGLSQHIDIFFKNTLFFLITKNVLKPGVAKNSVIRAKSIKSLPASVKHRRRENW